MKHLFRMTYWTDYDTEDPQYIGRWSSTIPDSAFRDGTEIVHIDWSTPGEVEVTFLLNGPGVGDRP